MARMHSRKKGKSGSTKPLISKAKKLCKLTNDEIEKLIINYGKKGLQSAAIGRILKEKHNIVDVKELANKKISKILKENKIYSEFPEDMMDLMRKAVNIKKHLEKNKKDLHSTRGFKNIESKIKRLTKYYKNKKILDNKWRYNIENAKILIE